MDKPLHKLDLFFSHYKPLHFKAGEVILRPGDVPAGVYYLKRGFVRLFSVSKEGEEFTLIIFRDGDFFPLMWAINNPPNMYFLEALTLCDFWRVPRDEFLSFIGGNADVCMELTSRVLVRLGGLLQRMEYMAFGNAHAKIASILLICADRFGKKIGRGVVIQVPLTHSDIASLVGLTRETASIEIKRMENKGILGHKGRLLVIRNLQSLKKASLLES